MTTLCDFEEPYAPPVRRSLSTSHMELLTALASGRTTCGRLATKLGWNSKATLIQLRQLKKRGLAREIVNLWPHRWEMVQGASAGVGR